MLRMPLLAAALSLGCAAGAAAAPIQLGSLKPLGQVDARYQAFNVEMVEITGGRFWAPYGGPTDERYRQRPPIDLSNPRLVALAKALGPSLVRVSGTWSNNTYLPADGETRTAPPEGFAQVLTRNQWAAVVAFSKAVDAPIVTSFAASTGVRGPDGAWTPVQAQRVVDLTKALGGRLYAAEFFNEPNIPSAAPNMPAGYTAARYASDFRIFRDWAAKAAPDMKIVGPGGAGEGTLTKDAPAGALGGGFVRSEDMIRANPGAYDAISYHFYGGVSQRCAGLGLGTAQKADALGAAWLDRTLLDFNFYGGLRDRLAPGKPLWNTETAQAACGGSPWASTFLDSFRYLNQLGVLAQKGVQVVMHNTLAASDYGLIDQDTLVPRPNYWAAVLWKRTMGRTVLAPPASPSANLRLYAHCLPQGRGGVGLLALNVGDRAERLELHRKAQAWVMTGQPVDTREAQVNGKTPGVGADGQLTGLEGAPAAGSVTVPGHAIAFVAVASAGAAACR